MYKIDMKPAELVKDTVVADAQTCGFKTLPCDKSHWTFYVEPPKMMYDIIPKSCKHIQPDDSLEVIRVGANCYNEGWEDCMRYIQEVGASIGQSVSMYNVMMKVKQSLIESKAAIDDDPGYGYDRRRQVKREDKSSTAY